jgi:hypothetical protein
MVIMYRKSGSHGAGNVSIASRFRDASMPLQTCKCRQGGWNPKDIYGILQHLARHITGMPLFYGRVSRQTGEKVQKADHEGARTLRAKTV